MKEIKKMKRAYKYILVSAMSCAMVCGNAFAQNEPSTDAIHASKEIIPVDADNGQYKIHLETYVTGSSVTTITEETKPVDLVLVLDTSNSMVDNNSGIASTTKWVGTERDVTYNNYRDGSTSTNDYLYSGGYVLHNGGYYQLQRGNNSRYLYITVNGNTLYFNGSGWTSRRNDAKIGNNNNAVIGHITVYEKQTMTRLGLLKQAVAAFIDQVETSAKGKDGESGTTETNKDNIAHRISIVSFNNSETYETSNNTATNYADDFVNVLESDGSSNAGALKNIVNNMSTYYYTRHDRGMLAANNILNAIPSDRKAISSKVVVFFTDGEPYYGTSQGDDINSHAKVRNQTVAYAHTAKTTHEAKVFTVTLGDLEAYDLQYMEYVSSNYPTTTGVTTNTNNRGTVTGVTPIPAGAEKLAGATFCFSTENGNNLTQIFTQIASSSTQGGETYPLDAETSSVIDVVSDNFVVPSGVTVTIWHESCYGVDNNPDSDTYGEYLWVGAGSEDPDIAQYYYSNGSEAHLDTDNTDPQKVKVVGFDYAADDEWNTNGTIKTKGNWVGARKDADDNIIGYWGNKVVIEFPISVNPDYEGGYSMPSNDITSGVYVGDVKVKPYPVPAVDFPSICIMKEGLAVGESAIFEVYKGEVTATSKPLYNLVLTQRANAQGDKLPCYVVLKRLDSGLYTVKEKNWSWLYTTDPSSKSIEQTVISAEKMNITVEDILAEDEVIVNNGTEVGMTLTRDLTLSGAEAGEYTHTFIVLADKEGSYDSYELDDLKGSAISLLYYFSNTRETAGKAARAEAFVRNQFHGGNTEGGTETGRSEIDDM